MAVIGRIIKGVYYDSVTLMRVSGKMSESDEVEEVSIVMGTAANKSILEASGMMLPEFTGAGDADLLLVVRLADATNGETVLDQLEEDLKSSTKQDSATTEFNPSSMEGALEMLPNASLALISVAGQYAGAVAANALNQGLHVMIFSDNVPVETERRLKESARDKGLLVMGPDCGTAIINGIPLGFANAVPRGTIGIVAASGTGLQEVSSIIANEGCGISQAIGTGGHDLKSDIGGIMFMEGIKALDTDPDTDVIVLISKPPDAPVLEKIQAIVNKAQTPIIAFYLGEEPKPGQPSTLEDTALMAVAHVKGLPPESVTEKLAETNQKISEMSTKIARSCGPKARFVRGLFSGGTFCSEAQTLFVNELSPLYSNIPVKGAHSLDDPMVSTGHTVIDLGDDQFTMGRPHPMIDFSLRRKRLLAEAADEKTAVILLDVVLGYGSNPDPAAELEEAIKSVSANIPVICSVTGTDQDFQNKPSTIQRLTAAGAVVMSSNAAACRLTLAVLNQLNQ